MQSKISEDKKESLLDLVSQIDDDLSDIVHNLETDEAVPYSSWRNIDNESSKIFRLLSQLKEEIRYS